MSSTNSNYIAQRPMVYLTYRPHDMIDLSPDPKNEKLQHPLKLVRVSCKGYEDKNNGNAVFRTVMPRFGPITREDIQESNDYMLLLKKYIPNLNIRYLFGTKIRVSFLRYRWDERMFTSFILHNEFLAHGKSDETMKEYYDKNILRIGEIYETFDIPEYTHTDMLTKSHEGSYMISFSLQRTDAIEKILNTVTKKELLYLSKIGSTPLSSWKVGELKSVLRTIRNSEMILSTDEVINGLNDSFANSLKNSDISAQYYNSAHSLVQDYIERFAIDVNMDKTIIFNEIQKNCNKISPQQMFLFLAILSRIELFVSIIGDSEALHIVAEIMSGLDDASHFVNFITNLTVDCDSAWPSLKELLRISAKSPEIFELEASLGLNLAGVKLKSANNTYKMFVDTIKTQVKNLGR